MRDIAPFLSRQIPGASAAAFLLFLPYSMLAPYFEAL